MNVPKQFSVLQTSYYTYYSGYYHDDDSTSTTDYSDDDSTSTTEVDTSIYGFLSVDLTQGSFSLTTVKDVNPLDIGTFFGNIGGFWGKV